VATDEHRGARLGTRIAQIVSQAIVSTHQKLLDTKHRLAVMVFNTVTNEISDEVDTGLGPLLKAVHDGYDDDGLISGLTHFMAHGRGQFKAIVGSNATAQSLLWALGAVISNELAPISYQLIETNPHLIPDPASLAGFAATGRISEGDARRFIAQNGFQPQWAERWIDAQKSYPTITDLVEFSHRGMLSHKDFLYFAKKAGFDEPQAELYLAASESQISYQDKALAYLRGMVTLEDVYSAAREQGVLQADVDVFLSAIGEPPATQELLEGYRRGFINRETLERGIKQSRMRNEWIPFLEQLRYTPMSTSEAVNAAVQNHLSQDEARKYADENGLTPGQFDVLYQAAGSPLSRTELNDLYNRGVIGSDVVLQGLRESRLKDKYGKDAFELRRRLLEPEFLGSAVSNGLMPHDVAIKKAMERGFSREDAATLVSSASHRKMEQYHNHLVSEIETLYADGAFTQEEAVSAVKALGFSDEEAKLLTQVADYKREHRTFQSAVNAIRSRYVSRHITKGQASSKMDAVGVKAKQRDYLLHTWELERAANVRVLTEGQVIRAIKMQNYTPEQGIEKLIDMGYSTDDAILLVANI
jgi:hypothetical protein